MKLVNFHTHFPKDLPNSIDIYIQDIRHIFIENPIGDYFCLGVHPWFIEDFDFELFEDILVQAKSKNEFFALGEIGLDKACNIDFKKQVDIFEKQIKLAKKLSINTIVIHSVRAHNECLQSLVNHKFKGNILIHDFRSNSQVLEQYQKHFTTYISIGESFMKSPKAPKLLSNISHKWILLETDSEEDYDLLNLHEKYSQLSGLSIDSIKAISNNALLSLKQKLK